MKTIPILFFVVVAFCVPVRGATPAFSDFNQDQFWTTNNKVSLKPSGVTNFPAGPTYVFNGKVSFTSNVFVNSLNFSSNAASAGLVLNLNGGYQALVTNNNVLYSGFSFLTGTGNTNIAWTSTVVTNTSGSLKTIGFLGCIGDTNVFVTNQSWFTIVKYPGMGTNVVGRSLN